MKTQIFKRKSSSPSLDVGLGHHGSVLGDKLHSVCGSRTWKPCSPMVLRLLCRGEKNSDKKLIWIKALPVAFFLMMNLTLLLILGLVLRCVMRLAIEMVNSKYWRWSKIFLIFYINYFNILDLAIWLVFSFTLFVVLCSVVSVALRDVGSMALKRMVVRKMVPWAFGISGYVTLGWYFVSWTVSYSVWHFLW